MTHYIAPERGSNPILSGENANTGEIYVMNPIPISLIIDDGGPVNMFHFHDLYNPHEMAVPPSFTKEFAKVCRKNGIMGKFSLVPMPAGLGRIDEKINGIPGSDLRKHIKIIKEEIEPVFSITPEILTHYRALNLEVKVSCKHIFEDVFVAGATAEEIADYVAFALEILVNAGFNPTGMTSPWATGNTNEENYAKGIGMAFKRVMNAEECFYFLHSRQEEWKVPVVMVDTPETGKVVTVPNNTKDAFWDTQNPVKTAQARKNAKMEMDAILSPDGKSGVMRTLFEEGTPLVFITHWQSIFSDGRNIGLEGLDVLTKRINKVFGNQIEWMPMAELAKRWTK